MTVTYYDRKNVVHLDGTNVFATTKDQESETAVAAQVEAMWSCRLARFGALAPIDWYAIRFERMVGLLELKARTHTRFKYPTVFLNVRKWLALHLGSLGMGVPSVFIVKFEDGLFWVPVNEIDVSERIRIAGCSRRVKADNDIEPVIEVPTSILRPLHKQEGKAS